MWDEKRTRLLGPNKVEQVHCPAGAAIAAHLTCLCIPLGFTPHDSVIHPQPLFSDHGYLNKPGCWICPPLSEQLRGIPQPKNPVQVPTGRNHHSSCGVKRHNVG